MCSGLSHTTLETLRALARSQATLDSTRITPMHRLVEACSDTAVGQSFFAPPGLGLSARPNEQALMKSLCLASHSPAEALEALPECMAQTRQDAVICALADLFAFLYAERAASISRAP